MRLPTYAPSNPAKVIVLVAGSNLPALRPSTAPNTTLTLTPRFFNAFNRFLAITPVIESFNLESNCSNTASRSLVSLTAVSMFLTNLLFSSAVVFTDSLATVSPSFSSRATGRFCSSLAFSAADLMSLISFVVCSFSDNLGAAALRTSPSASICLDRAIASSSTAAFLSSSSFLRFLDLSPDSTFFPFSEVVRTSCLKAASEVLRI